MSMLSNKIFWKLLALLSSMTELTENVIIWDLGETFSESFLKSGKVLDIIYWIFCYSRSPKRENRNDFWFHASFLGVSIS